MCGSGYPTVPNVLTPTLIFKKKQQKKKKKKKKTSFLQKRSNVLVANRFGLPGDARVVQLLAPCYHDACIHFLPVISRSNKRLYGTFLLRDGFYFACLH